ncbi:type I-E CRISPR-associated protein Cas5/CasD [Streptomyces sp. NPDC056549]|uniref:type I-E CRISPR-associated protein Cas5/CasD n=1 Tax=Streptomyces sp. NPDC056549 TaxID=3345864 RepID=UPI0036C86BD9
MSSPEQEQAILLLRLAAPLQSWGGPSENNRRETRPEPTKSGVVGLLAAAAGRRRGEQITDLAGLRLAVRADQPGSLLRDYHTLSEPGGEPLLSAQVNAKGLQKRTSPAKPTHITRRYYLQDAVFVAALQGPRPLIEALAHAVRNPAFPLALGRRSCVPCGPLLLGAVTGKDASDLEQVLRDTEWQAGAHVRTRHGAATVSLAATIEDPGGDHTAADVPLNFSFCRNGTPARTTRTVRHTWLTVPTGLPAPAPSTGSKPTGRKATGHDPFALLGW